LTLSSPKNEDEDNTVDPADTVAATDGDVDAGNPVESAEEELPLAQTFEELKLSQRVYESLSAANFNKPTQIQAMFIPKALTGQDVMGQARTGTGKTCAFLVPIFEKIQPEPGKVQALILAPTRELALQITSEIVRLGTKLGFSSVTLYGGSSYEPQIEALKSGVNIIVGTPGRVMDHMRSGRLDLSAVKIAVLDEADRMLDLGFRKDIEYILKHCPKERQTLLLSATIPPDIMRLAHKFMNDPLEVWTAQENLSVSTIEQSYFVVDRDNKFPHLLKLLDTERPQLAIIFCGTKMGAKRVAEKLLRLKISAREIHGDLQQSRREKIMDRFRTGKIKLLIATDVASRGIDVNDITHVINYDIPYKTEDYVHRVGRTGRIGKKGKAFTFVYRDEGEYLTNVEQLVNHELISLKYDDLTSKWWPKAPETPDPDYHDADDSREAAADQASSAAAQPDKKGGRGGRDRKSGGSSSGGSRGGSSRGSSTPSAPSAPRAAHPPRVHAPRAAAPAPIVPMVDNSGPIQAMSNYAPEPLIYDVDGLPADNAEPHEMSGIDYLPPDAGSAAGAEGSGEEGGPGKRRRRSRGRGRNKTSGGEAVAVTCSQCGTATTVPFVPRADKPIYCQECYNARKAGKASGGAPSSAPAAEAAPGQS